MFLNTQDNRRRQDRPAAVRVLCALLLLACASCAHALQGEGDVALPALASFNSIVMPTYLEQAGNPAGTGPDAGWRIWGAVTQFSNTGPAGALHLNGGWYSSSAYQTQRPATSRTALPMTPWDAEPAGRAQLGSLGALFSGGAQARDEVTYQRVNYARGGLQFSGSYLDVGQQFLGLDAIKGQMQLTDPTTAQQVALGMKRVGYDLKYTGLSWMNFTSSNLTTTNSQQGHAENGLTRSVQQHSLGLMLGQAVQVNYLLSTQADAWDPAAVKRDALRTDTQKLQLTGRLGGKSSLSLAQTRTERAAGITRANDTRHDLALTWNEWDRLGFTGSYMTLDTEQTGGAQEVLNLALTAKPITGMQLTSKYLGNAQLANRTATEQGTASWDHTLAWTLAPTWMVNARQWSTEATTGSRTDLAEYALAGTFGPAGRTSELRLISRQEDFAAQGSQARYDLSVTRPLGGAAAWGTLLLKAGMAEAIRGDRQADGTQVSAQLLNVRLTKRTTAAFGFYDGTVLAANDLAYRGLVAPPTPVPTLWRIEDLAHYREWGGQLAHQFTDGTKVTLKQFHGETDTLGARDNVEYTLERTLLGVQLVAGQLYSAQPGKEGQVGRQETWWRATLPFAQTLPQWAVASARPTVFTDSQQWGMGVAPPVLAAPPVAGVTIERRQDMLITDKPLDAYSYRVAGMLGDHFFLQAALEKSPTVQNNWRSVDPVNRELVHLAYHPRADMTLFGRYLDEARTGQPAQRCWTLGMAGILSPRTKLQWQVDALTRQTGAVTQKGIAYSLEFTRNFRENETLVLKYRYQPEEFSTPTNHIQLEASLNYSF